MSIFIPIQYQNRKIDQCNRVEHSEIYSHKYSQLIFEKEQSWYIRAKIVFPTNGAKKKKKKTLDTDFSNFKKKKNKTQNGWLYNVKCRAIKLLEDNKGKNLDDPGCGNSFLDTTLKTPSMKKIIDKLYFITVKTFFSVKDNIKRIRKQATQTDKLFAKTHLIKYCHRMALKHV